MTYDINGNSINGAKSNAITVNLGTSSAAATMVGKIRNNLIGTTGVALSCSTDANGIEVDAHGNGTHTLSITGNTIKRCFDRGILGLFNDGNGAANVTITGNTINEMLDTNAGTGTPREAFEMEAGSTNPNLFGLEDSHAVCLNITSTSGNMTGGAFKNGDIRIRQRFASSITLPGYTPPGGNHFDTASVITFVQGNNPGGTTTAATNNSGGSATDGYFGGAGCTQPSIPNPADDSVRKGGSGGPLANVVARVETPMTAPIAKLPVAQTAITMVPAKVGIASVTTKATTKASAAEVARIYRSERPLSNHAVGRNFNASAQKRNAPTSGQGRFSQYDCDVPGRRQVNHH